MSYNREQILRHLNYYEAVSGTASSSGSKVLGGAYPLMISPHEDNEKHVSLFELHNKPPYKVRKILITAKTKRSFGKLVDTFLSLVDKRTISLIYEGETDIPKDVRRYYYEHRDQGRNKRYAMALAWSRYCKYKHPNSPRCKQEEYLTGKNRK